MMRLIISEELTLSDCMWTCCVCKTADFPDALLNSSGSPSEISFDATQEKSMNAGPKSPGVGRQSVCKKSTLNTIRCTLVNCQSARTKAADIAALVIETHKPDILCGVESWLDPSIGNNEIFPSDFTIFREDRITETTGGGVFQATANKLITNEFRT
jgi:hypothetical protein